LNCLFFHPKEGLEMFLENVSGFLPNYMVIKPENSTLTAARTSNPKEI
jgi:hypothetical protein